MSDLAVVDVDSDGAEVASKSYALLGQFRSVGGVQDATLSALLRALPGEPNAIAGLSDPANNYVDVRDHKATARAINDVEAVVVVSPAFGTSVRASAYLSRLALRAKLRGQVVAFINASGQTPKSTSNRFFVRNAVQHADLTILRDELAADALLAAGVEGPLRIGADPAWSELGDLYAASQQEDRVVVALNDEVIDIDYLSGVLSAVADSGLEVVLQPSNSNRAAEIVAERLPGNVSVIERPTNLREARDLYSTSRAVVALRFHALMAAASAGAPTIALGDNNFAQFAESLGVPVASNGTEPTEAAKVLMETLEHGSVGSRAVPQLIDRAKATVDLVRLLLTEGEDLTQSANNPLPLYPQPWR